MTLVVWTRIPVALTLALAASSSQAEVVDCGKGLICASKPETVVKALQEAGYKAKLVTEREKDPYIETSMNGYSIDLLFNDCEKNKQCKALAFRVGFTEDSLYTPELMNKWNIGFRFMQMYRRDNGGMSMNYDFTTVGGLNQANFTSITKWMDDLLAEMDRFIDAERAAEEKAKAAPSAP